MSVNLAHERFLPHPCTPPLKWEGNGLSKSRRDERTQTGVLAPGNDVTTKEAPRGDRDHNITDTEQVTRSVALSGLENYG